MRGRTLNENGATFIAPSSIESAEALDYFEKSCAAMTP
jgi:hypothetical protein